MNHYWMSWKWGGRMNSKPCIYFCEGEDDLKLVNALKLEPSKILQGSSRKLNVVQNLEDELTRCTDVKSVLELTKSKSLSNFKTDFKKMKDIECRYALERHKIDVDKLWSFNASRYFNFVIRNQAEVKC
jgi:hypothetical protein